MLRRKAFTEMRPAWQSQYFCTRPPDEPSSIKSPHSLSQTTRQCVYGASFITNGTMQSSNDRDLVGKQQPRIDQDVSRKAVNQAPSRCFSQRVLGVRAIAAKSENRSHAKHPRAPSRSDAILHAKGSLHEESPETGALPDKPRHTQTRTACPLTFAGPSCATQQPSGLSMRLLYILKVRKIISRRT